MPRHTSPRVFLDVRLRHHQRRRARRDPRHDGRSRVHLLRAPRRASPRPWRLARRPRGRGQPVRGGLARSLRHGHRRRRGSRRQRARREPRLGRVHGYQRMVRAPASRSALRTVAYVARSASTPALPPSLSRSSLPLRLTWIAPTRALAGTFSSRTPSTTSPSRASSRSASPRTETGSMRSASRRSSRIAPSRLAGQVPGEALRPHAEHVRARFPEDRGGLRGRSVRCAERGGERHIGARPNAVVRERSLIQSRASCRSLVTFVGDKSSSNRVPRLATFSRADPAARARALSRGHPANPAVGAEPWVNGRRRRWRRPTPSARCAIPRPTRPLFRGGAHPRAPSPILLTHDIRVHSTRRHAGYPRRDHLDVP